MQDDQDALVSENQRLRKANRRWKAVAIAALVLVFVVMLPLSVAINEATKEYMKPRPVVPPPPEIPVKSN